MQMSGGAGGKANANVGSHDGLDRTESGTRGLRLSGSLTESSRLKPRHLQREWAGEASCSCLTNSSATGRSDGFVILMLASLPLSTVTE